MGFILGVLAVALGIVGVKYSVGAIVAGIAAIVTFFKIRKE